MDKAKNTYLILLQPVGKRVVIKHGENLLEAVQLAGVSMASLCGGSGTCESCRVRLIQGSLSPPSLEEQALFSHEELSYGNRLACQAYPQSDIVLDIPPESLTTTQRLQVEGLTPDFPPDPIIHTMNIVLSPPTMNDLRADATRLFGEIKSLKIVDGSVEFEKPVLDNISTQLRKFDWNNTIAIRNNRVVAILPPSTQPLGLAVDIGTTKLAAYLCDLSTGITLAKSGAMNPQTAYGEDVISRISYASKESSGRKILQERVVETLNQLIRNLCQQASQNKVHQVLPEYIVEAVFVGNTAMHHLIAGLPVQQLGTSPYVPAVSQPIDLCARDIGVEISPGAYIHLPPNIAGYIGADHVAMLLATKLWQYEHIAIALDIGTNTEISLMHQGQLLSCSCASGPAFEGAHILAGMRAAPGAIERVQAFSGDIHVQTIDHQPPIGICGSGILDAISVMVETGAVDRRGALIQKNPRVQSSSSGPQFVLVDASQSGNGREIVITRKDVNEIQLAKGAIRAGIEILLAGAGISKDEIQTFIIAGAFGSYIHIPSAINLGMFPKLPLDRFIQVGNAAGAGARQMLINKSQRQLAQEIAAKIRYVELSAYPNFTTIFSKALYLE